MQVDYYVLQKLLYKEVEIFGKEGKSREGLVRAALAPFEKRSA